MSHSAEFGKFAHAYGSYCGELKKDHKRILIDSSFADKADCNLAIAQMTNWAANKRFSLNKLCKRIRGTGFIDSFFSDKTKEDFLNNVYP